MKTIQIRELNHHDCEKLHKSFSVIGWNKPVELFQKYHKEQEIGLRECYVAFVNDDFAAYCTILRKSKYEHFATKEIAEISDLNVLPSHQKCEIGTQLIQECEKYAKVALNSKIIGLGVGLTADYSNALNLYLKLGYQFDGYGVAYCGKTLKYGETTTVDDEMNLYLTKNI